MNKLTKILILILAITAAGMSAVLFEVKNTADAVIVEVSDDGVRFFNPAVAEKKDTIMVIAANSIKANATLERDFDIADVGNTSKGRGAKGIVMKMSVKDTIQVLNDSAIVYYKPKNAFRTQTFSSNPALFGKTSFGSGYNCEASGEFSTAMGYRSVASGRMATALGFFSQASGVASVSLGSNTNSSGPSCFTSGFGTQATGEQATAMGAYTIAAGASSFAVGSFSKANGFYSAAIGNEVTSQANSSVAIGRFNKIEGDMYSWNDTDPLFVIGNGKPYLGESGRSNAFEVKKNGNTYINGTAYISGNTYIPSLYTTTSARPQKALYVDAQGKLCISDLLPPKEQSGSVDQLKKENDELKVRVAKLEALVEKMLKK